MTFVVIFVLLTGFNAWLYGATELNLNLAAAVVCAVAAVVKAWPSRLTAEKPQDGLTDPAEPIKESR